ncbi:MAG: hypothetical protein LBD24_03710 [Spirochaetaceae bacterium]|jgi:hypothetical protein|nr:hypothetical protein [Spirochaetaceae bacterium]
MGIEDFGEKMKGLLEQGAQTSKEFASKAGARAQNLGEQGILTLDIKKLKGQVEKLTDRLGKEAYTILTADSDAAVRADTPAIKAILDEIAAAREQIDRKEAELREKKEQRI